MTENNSYMTSEYMMSEDDFKRSQKFNLALHLKDQDHRMSLHKWHITMGLLDLKKDLEYDEKTFIEVRGVLKKWLDKNSYYIAQTHTYYVNATHEQFECIKDFLPICEGNIILTNDSSG